MYQRTNSSSLKRASSICPCPTLESVLLDHVLNNETRNIRRLVSIRRDLLEHKYYPEYNKPILYIALCEENVNAETVKTLIELGANTRYTSEVDENWEAIHFAACRTNSKILEAVIEKLSYLDPAGINAIANGNNALHVLIKHGKNDVEEESRQCAEILIESGINVNLGDVNGVSPILWAAKKGYKTIVKAILERSVVPVDIDTHKSRNKTARDIIVNENLYDGPLPGKVDNSEESARDVLIRYLKTGNENGFVAFAREEDIYDLVNSDDSSQTLLQLACWKGLKRSVAYLLDKGADPNKTTINTPRSPLEIVASEGFYEIFEMLLNNPKTQITKDILQILLKNIDNDQFGDISHEKCFDLLLSKLKSNEGLLDVNGRDESSNTSLHYAIRYGNQKCVDELLNLGASLGAKNKYDHMHIQDMEPDQLEKHLDNCVMFNVNSKQIEKEDFSITFNYRSLIPPLTENNTYNNNDAETGDLRQKNTGLVPEMEVISYMSKAPEFRHLLKHPVIVSFLFMKWHRIRWLFYTNLAFYIMFFTSLVVFIFAYYANFSNEDKSSLTIFLIHLSWFLYLVTYLLLVVRELFQIIVSPGAYFKNFENYVEIILIFIAGAILFTQHPSVDGRKQLSSIVILLAAFELVLMLGQHPTLSTNVVMLRTVSFNFFKFLLWYSVLIIAFALSFYILFTEVESGNGTANKTADAEEEDFFTDPGKSVFKTIVMLTGEFDAGSINFQTFPVTSKLIFSLFIFMIAIILLNLLNGLAVSDTQMIKSDAELVGHIARAQHVSYVESMLLGNVLPKNLFRQINNLCCCIPGCANLNFVITKPLAERASFPRSLNYRLEVLPNCYGKIKSEGSKTSLFGKKCIGSCGSVYLDRETIKRTRAIIQARREELKRKSEENYLNKIQEMINDLKQINLRETIDIDLLNKKVDTLYEKISNLSE